MTKGYLLDTNILVAALDKDGSTEDEDKKKARQRLTALLREPDVALGITPLIRYEVLRGVQWSSMDRYSALLDALAGFHEFEVGQDVSELAANLFRFERAGQEDKPKRAIDKRRFDVFHMATAKVYELEMASNDADMKRLENLYVEYCAEINRS